MSDSGIGCNPLALSNSENEKVHIIIRMFNNCKNYFTRNKKLDALQCIDSLSKTKQRNLNYS